MRAEHRKELGVTVDRVRMLYKSSNGDVGTAGLNDNGKLVVIHQPNAASGGKRYAKDVARS